MPAVKYDRYKRDRHDNALNQVCRRSSQKAAQCRICNDNHSTDHHSRHIIHAEQGGKQLSAGCESACRIRDKKDDNHNCRDTVEHIFIMVSFGKKVRHRNGSDLLAVAADFFGYKKPVQPGSKRQSDRRPRCIADPRQIGDSRQPHQ
jgi:hypothetical protein